MFDIEFEYGLLDSNLWKNEFLESEESLSDDFFILKCFKFGESVFIFFFFIDLDNGFLYVIGCDWKLENEIVIID